jgi:hypothetical protein
MENEILVSGMNYPDASIEEFFRLIFLNLILEKHSIMCIETFFNKKNIAFYI